jgi:general stress protein 26
MIKLIDQMQELINNALANGSPCILATAAPDGEPDIGFKGSMMVFDDESLAYWERTKRQHLKNITANPKVVVLFRDAKSKAAWRFHGIAAVHEAGPIRDQVMARTVAAELEKDPDRKGAAVVIKLDRVTNMAGQVLQSR